MKLTEEHKAMDQAITRLVERDINPHVESWEEAGIFPAHDVFKKLGDGGFLGITKPEAFGGLDLDYSYAVIAAEAFGRIACGGVPMAIGVQTDMCTPALARFGDDDLKQSYLAPSIAGDLVGCIGVSETGAGSDVASIRTTARSDGDDYIINGGKMWITNGVQADWMCLLANTGEGLHNKTLIIMPLDTPGVTVTKKLHKLGMWSSDTAQFFFDDVRVPKRNRIGEEGRGFQYQMMQFQEERLWAAANMITALDEAIAETIRYARERALFGGVLLDKQVVQFRMAELATEVESLRALLYRATELYVGGEDVTRLASMCKLKAGRLGREVADACLQFHGGQGYLWESRIARLYRDTRLASIGGGADEVMLQIIGKHMGMISDNR